MSIKLTDYSRDVKNVKESTLKFAQWIKYYGGSQKKCHNIGKCGVEFVIAVAFR